MPLLDLEVLEKRYRIAQQKYRDYIDDNCGGSFSKRRCIRIGTAERRLIEDTWLNMKVDTDANYMHMLNNVLRRSQRIARIFHLANYTSNPILAHQHIVSNADKLGCFLSCLIEEVTLRRFCEVTRRAFSLGVTHAHLRHVGLRPSDFYVFAEALAEYFQRYTGGIYTKDAVRQVWLDFLFDFCEEMENGYRSIINVAQEKEAIPTGTTEAEEVAEEMENVDQVDVKSVPEESSMVSSMTPVEN